MKLGSLRLAVLVMGWWCLIAAPHLLPAERAVDGSQMAEVRDIVFRATVDQSEQRYVLLLPANFDAQQDHDVLLALHGHGADRWQFVRDNRDECRAARDFASRETMLYVSPDYRARTSWMGPLAEADIVQIITELQQQYRVRRIFLCGGSMGGTSALTFAALHPELVSGVTSLNGLANHLEFTKFQEHIAESFGGTKAAIPAEYKKRSAEYWPDRLTMPVGMTVGGKDTVVPPDSCRRLANVLHLLERRVLLIDRAETEHLTNYEDSLQALDFMLLHADPGSDNK